ncbi:MAG: S8 family serine peptidase, partial [Erysipelotrichales bacterium]|nr:S8 family serine peptidase [Erysipelotrichales bacterium]
MREVWKKLLAVLVVVLMMTNQTVSALAYETPEGDDKETGTELVLEDLDPKSLGIRYLGEEGETPASPAEDLESLTDIVRVSIVLEDESTLEHGYSAENIAYNTQAVSYRDALKVKQDELTARIEKEIGAKLDVQWNMTLAVNIISANVKVKDIPLIENVEGVKKVVRENRYEALVDDPKTVNTSQFMVGASSAWSAGYYGAGSRIAIIDTGIDTTHQSFNADAFNHAIAEDGSSSELMTQISSTVLNSLNAKSKLSSLTAAQTYVSAKIPFGFNYVDGSTTINHINDTQGEHGSHVAGIASANRYIKNGSSYDEAISSVKAVGMAPDAQLLIMKVFGSKGGAYDSDYMVAIEDAITLGADAVNLSLGSGAPGWTYDSTYQDVLNNLSSSNNVKTVVSISAGNAGPITENLTTDLYIEDVGMHTGGSPGSFLNSLGVASADNIGETGTPLTFNGNQTVYYTETESTGAAMSSIAGSYSYVFIDAVGNTADYQAVNSAESLSGKIVIVNRGELSFYEKGNNAKSYSPKAVIVANNQAGAISMDLSDYTGTFPMVSITLSDANTIKANSTAHTTGNYTYYTGSVTVTNAMSSGLTTSRDNAIVSSFSSWGVPGSLVMKPEITAPGGSIRSVAGTNKTTSGATAGGSTAYEIMSGTSMAAPHITGLSALVAEYLRENDLSAVNSALTSKYTNRAIVQSLLMSTATPMKPNGEYLSILQQGSGLAEVSKAVSASSVIMMSEDDDTLTASTGSAADGKVKAEFGDDPKRQGEYEYSFTIYNITDTDLAYTLATDLFTQKAEDGFMREGTEAITANVRYIYDSEGAVSHDVDKDGDTDNDDAQAILDYLTGKLPASDADLSAADLDNDGAVTSADARLLLGYEPTVQEGLIVKAGSSKKVTVKISLKNKDALDASHPNGAYVEGYTYVNCTTKGAGDGVSLEHTHSIPLLGFYGSWTDPSMFDNTSYIDTLYGTDKTPYTGNRDTNYMTVTYNGVTSKFSGNPYIVEDSFPADRLALNSSSTIGRISYNLYRAAGTTGYAVTKLDEDGQVSSVLSSIVTGNEVTGIWYSQSNAAWQNLTTKVYNVNKAPSAYGLKDGDKFRAGFYAIPEYNAMMENATMTSGTSGIVGQAGFNRILTSNVLGKGAFVGYDFTIDNVEPNIESAVLNGNTLSILASDNRNLAYVAVMSLDGTVKYAEAAPGTDSYTISLDASDAIANARGYVAVFAGDYAG